MATNAALKEALLTIKTTAPKYLKNAEDHTIRKRLLLKILQSEGNIIYNVKTPQMIWDVEIREPKVRVLDGSGRHTFSQTDAYEQLCLDHSELEASDMIPRRQQMINDNSPQQIVDLAGTKMEKLTRTMTRRLNSQFYADNTSGTGVGLLGGINSFIKHSTAATATDMILIPDAGVTYGGKSIELGNQGGQWSADMAVPPNAAAATDWPFGNGSTEYDWNTPKIFNTACTVSGDAGWSNNCLKLVRRMSDTLASTGGEGDAPTVHLLGLDLLNEFKDKIETKERNFISDFGKNMGFPNTLTYEGAVVTHDFDCPATEGYAINPSEVVLYSVHDQLFFLDGGWETPEQATLFLVGFLGNWRFTPKCCGAYRNET